jgi:hypothetical protein
MPAPRKSVSPLQIALFAVMVIAPLSVLLALPWLKEQPDEFVFLYSGIAAAITVAAAFATSVIQDRHLDEWQRSASRFSTQWGFAIGAGVVALLLSVPSFRDWMVSTVADVADVPDPDQKLVILAFTFGFGFVVLATGLCTVLLSIAWVYWKSRPSSDAS